MSSLRVLRSTTGLGSALTLGWDKNSGEDEGNDTPKDLDLLLKVIL